MIATIIHGPHRLYTGGNGHNTYGITVRSIHSQQEQSSRGLQYEWNINDYTIETVSLEELMEKLGLSEQDALKLKADTLALSSSQA